MIYLKLFVYYTPFNLWLISILLVLYFWYCIFYYYYSCILFFVFCNFTSFSFLSTSKHFGSIYTCFVTLCGSVFVFHYQFVSPLVTVPCAVVVFVLSVYALCVFMCVCVSVWALMSTLCVCVCIFESKAKLRQNNKIFTALTKVLCKIWQINYEIAFKCKERERQGGVEREGERKSELVRACLYLK